MEFLRGARKTPTAVTAMGVLNNERKDETMLKDTSKDAEGQQVLFTADGSAKRRANAWLDAQLSRMKKQGKFCLLDHETTPELAELLLTLNINNRRPRNVERYKRAIDEGRWIDTGDPIRITTDGILCDGQNRLLAILAAVRTSRLTFIFGVPPEAFKVIDTGAKRTGGDTLQIREEKNSSLLAASLRMLYNIQRGMPRGGVSVDNDVLLDFLEAHPKLRDSCHIGSVVTNYVKVPTSAVVVSHYLITRRRGNSEAAEIFFDRLAKQLGITSMRDPAKVLKKYLEDELIGLSAFKQGRACVAIIRAWNAYKGGRGISVRKLDWATDEPFPEVE
jgi:hypothetical protein